MSLSTTHSQYHYQDFTEQYILFTFN